MIEEEFAALADRYGAQIEQWPTATQAPARALFDASPEARALLASSAKMQAALATLRDHAAPAGLLERIVADLPPPSWTIKVVDWLAGAVWRPAVVAAAPAALGFILGLVSVEPSSADPYLALALTDLLTEPAYAE